MSMSLTTDDRLIRTVKKTVPNLSTPKHKGQDGRIGIVGGSMEYTGAPYFAGMSALRLGADLVHIFCTKEASVPIKCLSPDLIVHPVLDHPTPVKAIKPWLDRLHVLIIGCGLGREEKNMKTVVELIGVCRYLKKPLVIDADGLFIIGMKPDLLKDYPGVILTPNAMEFSRLFNSFLDRSIQPASMPKAADVKLLADSIGKNVVILHKGAKDIIADGNKTTETVTSGLAGSGRRCGGQGDIMAGILAVFWWWAINAGPSDGSLSPQMTACYGASRMTRECNSATFKIKQRSMLASDMLEQIEPVFAKLFENNSTKVVVTPRSSSFSRRNRTRSSDM